MASKALAEIIDRNRDSGDYNTEREESVVESDMTPQGQSGNGFTFPGNALPPRGALLVFVVGFAVRLGGAVITSLTTINPDSTGDAISFASAANTIAGGLSNGELVAPGAGYIYDLWGLFLSPYWLLPGPSGFYARVGNAVLGAIAIYNVYVIVRHFHSRQAGFIAALPMLFFPSFVAIHSTVLREAIVLFGITTVTRLLALPARRRSSWFTYAVAGGVLYVAFIMRPDNAIIYAAAISSGVVVIAIQRISFTAGAAVTTALLGSVGFVAGLSILRNGVDYLARIRDERAMGRTVYLEETIPRTILEVVAFSWIGAAYFLYAPFPWMIETVPDLLISVESLISIGFTIAAIQGTRWLAHRNRPVTVGLLVGFAVAVVLYGVGTVNYGTAMRHRQMFLWIIFLFGAIGFSEHFRFTWGQKRQVDRTD